MKIYSFIAEEQANNSIWTICEMCRVLKVSRSGFHDWHGRCLSDRELSDPQGSHHDRRLRRHGR